MRILELRNITKSFGNVQVLKNISISLFGGEIHCLVGENGAGKSTIIKMLAGYHLPDSGEIQLDGKNIRLNSPSDAQKHGIAVIHQELQLITHLSVAENIFLGKWPLNARGIVDWKSMKSRAKEVLSKLNLDIDPSIIVSSLSTGQQQMVEICRALTQEAKLLILDEPTASLTQTEANELYKIVRQLSKQGSAILYVSHRMEEIFNLGYRITVLRDGQLVGSALKEEISPDTVVQMMVGRVVHLNRGVERNFGEVALAVRGMTRKKAFYDINFDIREGEIVGLAGLVGSGRTEILRSLFGIDRPDSGTVTIYGKREIIKNPNQAIKLGMGFVPEDRKLQGLILDLSIRDNTSISVLSTKLSKYGWIHKAAEKQLVNNLIRQLLIKAPSDRTSVVNLSGGNQQKVVLARWLSTKPRILLLDEPTRGVDIGARAEIQEIIEQLVRDGVAIILVSSDLEELMSLSDRLLVIRGGTIITELSSKDATKEIVLNFATGVNAGGGQYV